MRLLLKDLSLDTAYELQARIKSDGTPSEWSPKFKFTTVTDQIAPKVPTGVSFIVDDDSWLAEWDTVTENVDDSPAAIFKYNLQLRKGATIQKFSVSPSDEDVQEYGWTFEKIKQLFGADTVSLDFRVQAVNMARLKSDWSAWNNANINVPDAPTDAVVESSTDGLNISWTAPANTNNLAGYRVYISTSSADFTTTELNRVYEGAGTSFMYLTGTYATHYIKIVSYSKYGQESTPLLASGTPKSPFLVDTTAPDVPTGLAATLTRTGNVATANLTWTFNAGLENNEDIQGFAIKWYKTGDASHYYMEYASKDARSLAITLPQAFSDYQFQIASIDFVANYSAWSTAVSLNGSIPGAPPQVTGVTAKTGLDSLTLSWAASTALDVVYYNVDVATNSSFTTSLYQTYTGETNITISGLASNTTYYYRVSAVDTTAQVGTASTTASATTNAFPTTSLSDGNAPASSPPPTVSGGIGYLFVTWSPVTNNDLVTYEVHTSTTSNFTPSGTTKVAETTATVINLEKNPNGSDMTYGTTYYVKIIAKDRDGAAAAGAQGSGQLSKVANSDSSIIITAADVQTGTLSSSVITLGSGGQIKSSDYNPATNTGFSLTTGGLIIYNGTVAASTLQAGSTITNDLGITGNLTISSSGTIKSTNYSTTAGSEAGFSLSSAGLDIRSGTVWASVLKSGTISSADIKLGVNGRIIVDDATGYIQSNNWNGTSTGWRLDKNGATFYGLNATISASNVIGDTISGRTLSLTSGGSISGPGFTLSSTGLTISYGTVSASAITSGSLQSSQTVSYGGTSKPAWSVNLSGAAEFNDLSVRGRVIVGPVGSTDSSYIQSGNYSPGSQGWKIDAQGNAYFYSGTFAGNITGATVTTGSLQIGTGTNRVTLNSIGSIGFYDSSGSTFLQGGGGGDVYSTGGLYAETVVRTNGYMLTPKLKGWKYTGTAAFDLDIESRYTNFNMQQANFSNGVTIDLGGASSSIATKGGTISGGPTITGDVYINSIGDGGANHSNTGAYYVRCNTNGKLYGADTAPSTRKIKHDINPLVVEDYKKILQLEPKTYRYNEAPERLRPGFIAEEAHDLGLKCWVGYEDESTQETPNGFDYVGYVAALQLVAREQDNQIEALQSEVETLKENYNSLLARLDAAGI